MTRSLWVASVALLCAFPACYSSSSRAGVGDTDADASPGTDSPADAGDLPDPFDVPDGGGDVPADDDSRPEADRGEATDPPTDGDTSHEDATDSDVPCGPHPFPGPEPADEPCSSTRRCPTGFECLSRPDYCDVCRPGDGDCEPPGVCVWTGTDSDGCDPDDPASCPAGTRCEYAGTDLTGGHYNVCRDVCSFADEDGVPWTDNGDCPDGLMCNPVSGACEWGCGCDLECCTIWHDGEGGPDDDIRQPAEVTVLDPSRCRDTCDPCTNACVRYGCAGGGCEIGDPCEHDSDCPAGGSCLEEYGREMYFPGGICTMERCDLTGRECPAGGGCLNLGSPDDPAYGCWRPCVAGSEPGDPGFACRDTGEPGVPDAGDYACFPLFSDAWTDGTGADGFCYLVGNFPGGSTPLGGSCTDDSECLSPFGLGTCISPWDFPPPFCSVWCNVKMAEGGVCGTADAATGRATGGCLSGLCWSACDLPGGPLGANGCPQPDFVCYDADDFPTPVAFADAAARPLGLCLGACTDDSSCTHVFGASSTCDPTSGLCSPPAAP
ncbi:MAG: hypothetical protein HY905_05725 [Deltaproteobacteria bacterium]|nr:hypothetical protein [Deltaproteobacteria bacterium]